MYSSQGVQNTRLQGPLSDATNRLKSANGNPESVNGDFRKHQHNMHGGYRHSPAPYPPLPPAAPTALNTIYLPLPGAPTLPQLVANYASPSATPPHQQHESSPPLPPLPPPPPPPQPPCHRNYSPPPATSAPYPPLPRAGDIFVASLEVVNSPEGGAAAVGGHYQYCRTAVETPLPASSQTGLQPQLVADYHSPLQDHYQQHWSPPLPPPPPPPPLQQPMPATGGSTDETWLPTPPLPPNWEGPARPSGPVETLSQAGTSSSPSAATATTAAAAPTSLLEAFSTTVAGSPAAANAVTTTSRGDKHGSVSRGTNACKASSREQQPPQQQQQQQQRRSGQGKSRSGARKKDGRSVDQVEQRSRSRPPPPQRDTTKGTEQHSRLVDGTSTDTSRSSSSKSDARASRNKEYVIPKKGDSQAAVDQRGKNDDYVIPKKGRNSTPPSGRERQEGEQLHDRNRSRDGRNNISLEKASSGSRPARREGLDDTHRSTAASGRGDPGGSGGGGVRWAGDDERQYCRDDRNGSGRERRNGGAGGSSRQARDDNAIGGRYGGGDRDSYRRRDQCDAHGAGAGFESDASARGRHNGGRDDERRGSGSGGESKRGGGGGGGGGRRRAGKSCPPPSAEKRRNASAGATSNVETAAEKEDDELAKVTSQLTALELEVEKETMFGEGGRDGNVAGGAGKAYLSLEEYKEATAAGEIKPYNGSKYRTVDDRYADGWAYNPDTRRWIKVATQQKKNAIEALPALLARLELMESRDKLATQRSQLLETKVEKISKEKSTGRPTACLAMPTAPVLVVFDTNWLIHHLEDTMCRLSDIAGRHKDTSVLIPKEVLRELDRLKTRGKDETTRSRAQKANRYFRGLVEAPLTGGRDFAVVRVQEDTELFRDEGHHSKPEGLGGDDSILNCCMFFTQGIESPRQVTLVTGDNNFAIRASAHGLRTMGRPQCDPGHCRMPLCPAPPRPSPFSRGY